ncbi:aminoacyl-tRNA hydrolase [bacterium]|nr:aminoacyl-tRNA hydrolase [bacterium]MBU1883912.1 aminoacyl-tRNA hydrolase [bacterium]
MLIVGLGNPGSTYANTRHNIGFMVIDELVRRTQASPISKASFEGELFKFKNHYLLKPMTFMNLSGRSVLAVKNFYKIDEVLVIHDDLDLPFGALRFKVGGGHGGHNGLKSIDEVISKEYARVRMGISKPSHRGEVVSYVLSPFSDVEKEHLESWIKAAADAVMKLDTMSLEDVSSQYSIKQI